MLLYVSVYLLVYVAMQPTFGTIIISQSVRHSQIPIVQITYIVILTSCFHLVHYVIVIIIILYNYIIFLYQYHHLIILLCFLSYVELRLHKFN